MTQYDNFSRVLIEDVEAVIRGQADSGRTPRAHSYTKYNTWSDVRAEEQHLSSFQSWKGPSLMN